MSPQPISRRSAFSGAAVAVVGGVAGFAFARNSSAAKAKSGTTGRERLRSVDLEQQWQRRRDVAGPALAGTERRRGDPVRPQGGAHPGLGRDRARFLRGLHPSGMHRRQHQRRRDQLSLPRKPVRRPDRCRGRGPGACSASQGRGCGPRQRRLHRLRGAADAFLVSASDSAVAARRGLRHRRADRAVLNAGNPVRVAHQGLDFPSEQPAHPAHADRRGGGAGPHALAAERAPRGAGCGVRTPARDAHRPVRCSAGYAPTTS